MFWFIKTVKILAAIMKFCSCSWTLCRCWFQATFGVNPCGLLSGFASSLASPSISHSSTSQTALITSSEVVHTTKGKVPLITLQWFSSRSAKGECATCRLSVAVISTNLVLFQLSQLSSRLSLRLSFRRVRRHWSLQSKRRLDWFLCQDRMGLRSQVCFIWDDSPTCRKVWWWNSLFVARRGSQELNLRLRW